MLFNHLKIAIGMLGLIAFYYGGQWLKQFAYQIDMHWTLLILPFITLLIIVILSVGFQSLKVVLANPVNNLKDE